MSSMPYTIPNQLLMFGDSITQQSFAPGGFGAALQDAYQRRLDVVARGYNGYNSEWALHVAPVVLPRKADIQAGSPKSTIITIWFGANDATLPVRAASLPLQRYRDNLHCIISQIASPASPFYQPNAHIVLITPPPVGIAIRKADVLRRLGPGLPFDRTTERTKSFADACAAVAAEAKAAGVRLSLLDAYTPVYEAALLEGKGDAELGYVKYLSDGLHMTGEGYKLVTKAFFEMLERDAPHLTPEALDSRWSFPHALEIDTDDAATTFRLYGNQKAQRYGYNAVAPPKTASKSSESSDEERLARRRPIKIAKRIHVRMPVVTIPHRDRSIFRRQSLSLVAV